MLGCLDSELPKLATKWAANLSSYYLQNFDIKKVNICRDMLVAFRCIHFNLL